MRRIRLGIWSDDSEYLSRVAAYIRISEYRDRFRLALFTESSHCRAYLDGAEGLDVLLSDYDPVEEQIAERAAAAGCLVLRLVEGPHPDGDVTVSLPKFQPVNKLLDSVIRAAARVGGAGCGSDGGSTVLAVYSAAGGAGKTVFVYSAAGLLAHMGFKPIVLSLESIPSRCWRSSDVGGDPFGQALYHAGKESAASLAMIESCLEPDPKRRFYYLPAARHKEELEQMGEEDTARLIRAAAASAKGNVVLLDLDSARYPRTLAALKASDTMVCLVPDHMAGCDKTEAVFRELQETKALDRNGRKVSVLMTLCDGKPASIPPFPIDEALPFEKEWLNLTDMETLEARSRYRERLFRWLQEWTAATIPAPV